jgi:hypothetical protein
MGEFGSPADDVHLSMVGPPLMTAAFLSYEQKTHSSIVRLSNTLGVLRMCTHRGAAAFRWLYWATPYHTQPELYYWTIYIKVNLSLCFSWAPRHEDVLGSRGIAPRILGLGTRWRWVVSFTPRPLYSQGKSPWYPLDRGLGGTLSRSGHGSEEKVS